MKSKKILRQGLIAVLSVIFLLNAAIAHAETYFVEGSYIMSKFETLEIAKKRAKADAMRNAAEKANVYVKNYAIGKNLELEEDFIETITANILKLVEEPSFNKKNFMIRAKVKVQIDDSDINR